MVAVLGDIVIFTFSYSNKCIVISHGLNFMSLMANTGEYLFIGLHVVCMPSLVEYLFMPSIHFLIEWFSYCLKIFEI